MSTRTTRILVITCSTRPGALAPVIGEWFTRTVSPLAATLGAELEPVSLGELDLPFLDEEGHPAAGVYHRQHTKEWSALVEGADGFVLVTPEYNYGMPAVLKNALDYLSREWAWKPVGFVSYGHTSAGTRSVQHAKQIVSTLRLVPLGATVAIRIGDSIVDGQVRDDDRLTATASGTLEELVRLAHALRPMREAADRTVVTGPVPGSYARRLTAQDASEVTVLQRCCWVEEALANQTLDLPALRETPQEVRDWLGEWHATGLWRDGRLLGMVRARREGDTWQIARLATVPDLRGVGVGRWLLRQAEAQAEPGCDRVVLSTGSHSERNIELYQSEGFTRLADAAEEGVVHLSKPRSATDR